MITLTGDRVFYFDVDDTLVMWPTVGTSCPDEKMVLVDGVSLCPHEAHIADLKRLCAMGATIVVWSSGGPEWCAAVVKALAIEEWVSLCVAKPTAYYDDLDASRFMTTRVYLGVPQ